MESEYEKAKREFRIFYSSIGPVTCPVLGNEKVFFTKAGFNHLIRKGKIVRPTKEQMRRFRLVRLAEKALRRENVSILRERRETREVINRHGKKSVIRVRADFWRIETIQDGQLITIIIRKIGNGQKHFFSIMNKKTKKSPLRENL